MSEKIMELKTVQTGAFKTLTEALKEILTDANIEFTDSSMKIITMDPTQTILVHLKLEKDNFESYYCKHKIFIGVNMLNFFKLIKTLTNNDALTLFIEAENTNLLGIRIENGEKNSLTNYYLNLIEVDETTYQIPPAQFESIITMPSNEFNKICRDMINLSDIIEIKSVGSQLIFSCEGDFAKQETILGETSNGLNFVKSSTENNVIQGYYNLKHLVLFTKCTNLCNSIELYMKNNFPVVIKFSVGSLGSLKLALAPKVEDDGLS
jgi:proliferating cell nuclear antigen